MEPAPAVISDYLSFLAKKSSFKIAHLDTNLSFKKWNYDQPQNFKHV